MGGGEDLSFGPWSREALGTALSAVRGDAYVGWSRRIAVFAGKSRCF